MDVQCASIETTETKNQRLGTDLFWIISEPEMNLP